MRFRQGKDRWYVESDTHTVCKVIVCGDHRYEVWRKPERDSRGVVPRGAQAVRLGGFPYGVLDYPCLAKHEAYRKAVELAAKDWESRSEIYLLQKTGRAAGAVGQVEQV